MPAVQPFSRTMMDRFLQSSGLPYKADNDGDFISIVPDTGGMGCELLLYLTATGQRGDVLSLTALPTYQLPAARWSDALLACNEWNLEKRWPKAALKLASSSDKSGTFVLEFSLDLEQGVHQELLDDTMRVFVGSSLEFCRWAHTTKGFAGDRVEQTRPTYGFTAEDPILCDQALGEMQVLNSLRCPQGHRLRGDRRGSNRGKCTSPDTHHSLFGENPRETCIVDIYDVKCDGGEYSSILFFDMYHPAAGPPPVPQGLQSV